MEIEGVVLNFGAPQNPGDDIGLEGPENPEVGENLMVGGGAVLNPRAEFVMGNPEVEGGNPVVNPGAEGAIGDGGNFVNAADQANPEGGA